MGKWSGYRASSAFRAAWEAATPSWPLLSNMEASAAAWGCVVAGDGRGSRASRIGCGAWGTTQCHVRQRGAGDLGQIEPCGDDGGFTRKRFLQDA